MNLSTTPSPAQAVSPALAEDFARRLHGILAHLCVLVTARFPILGALTTPLHKRLIGISHRIVALLARLASGRRATPPRTGQRSGPPPIHLPRGHAWLVRLLGAHAASYAAQLEHLLSDPAFAPLLAAAPRARRILSPVLRALGLPQRAATRPRRSFKLPPPPRPFNDPLPVAFNLIPMAPFRLLPPLRPRHVLKSA